MNTADNDRGYGERGSASL